MNIPAKILKWISSLYLIMGILVFPPMLKVNPFAQLLILMENFMIVPRQYMASMLHNGTPTSFELFLVNIIPLTAIVLGLLGILAAGWIEKRKKQGVLSWLFLILVGIGFLIWDYTFVWNVMEARTIHSAPYYYIPPPTFLDAFNLVTLFWIVAYAFVLRAAVKKSNVPIY
jgi:hypothetical protein